MKIIYFIMITYFVFKNKVYTPLLAGGQFYKGRLLLYAYLSFKIR